MIGELDWQAFWSPIALSLRVALLSSVAAMALGVGAARWMTRRSFKGKTLLETAFMLPLVLPPTVVGFLLLVSLGRRSWIGKFAEWLFAAPIVFSWWAAVIASVVVAFPLVYQTMKTGFLSVDKGLEEAARSSGANERQVFAYITLPLAYRSFVTAYVLGFARGFGEFGATLMIAGNIPGRTQTTPTAIYIAVDAGNATMAWAWTLSMIAVSFVLLFFARARND
ncbi:molybdenum ABC transporter permease subunit [Cohnella sp. CIP 111063]|uniref:molybdate ABC transporter permease subunit n=1 Tax=unclassified Cohnella TaxID=2636738 RepID=UPI000B8C18C7|nr:MULTISPECIES: molybdate ABC transporter permease subunit [unclassified Cohnella]OXS61093.1 molybdenum ABC transporter permease subunit [Cohnella sp. CIP 111063]PRX73641.1 molybdate transport system permease protein [Cohnella sp. SGD-V74]